MAKTLKGHCLKAGSRDGWAWIIFKREGRERERYFAAYDDG
jgi:hypothetical protein